MNRFRPLLPRTLLHASNPLVVAKRRPTPESTVQAMYMGGSVDEASSFSCFY